MKTKRIIAVFVALLVCIKSFPITVFAENSNETAGAEFYAGMQNFIKEYTSDAITGNDISNQPLNRLIVKTDSNEPLEETNGAYDVYEGYDSLHILQYISSNDADNAYADFCDSDVEYVEYDAWITIGNVANDNWSCYCSNNIEGIKLCDCPENPEPEESFCACPDPTSGDHLSWNSVAVGVDEAFALIKETESDCKPVTVAILDTGLYAEHDYFDSSRIVLDKNYKLYESDQYPSDVDWHYHGTHVAGIIYDNTMSNVQICPYRIFTDSVMILPYTTLLSALNSAIENKVDVISMSIIKYVDEEAAQKNKASLYETLDKAINQNIVVVSAAGNENDNVIKITDSEIIEGLPASYEKGITVSATNRENKPDTEYTNYGDCVDIAAPGTDIYSTVPWVMGITDLEQTVSESLYMRDSGTSMATPLVAAAAATLKSINPDLTPQEIERIIKETAYVPEDWEENCGDKNYGTGIVNFYNMVKQEVSAQPTIKLNKDNKFEIIAPEGTDARLYYTLDGSEPTLDNHILYTEPFEADSENVDKIKAVCHENGKLISETVTQKMKHNVSLTVNYKQTKGLVSDDYTGKVYWHSNNPEIASVDENGNVTGVSVGQTYIYAAFASGKEIRYLVTVEYAWWQEILIYFCLGFIWYI